MTTESTADRTSTADTTLAAEPAAVVATVHDAARWSEWLPLHGAWTTAPGEVAVGAQFVQQVKIMGIPAEIEWQVTALDDTGMRWTGGSRVGVGMDLAVTVTAESSGTRLRVELGLSGDAVRGPMGASVMGAVDDAVAAALNDLAGLVGGVRRARRAGTGPVRHHRTGVDLDPTTPVVVGVGQVVLREPDPAADPVTLSVRALRAAAEDAGAEQDLLAAADAVYAVASTSWTYDDQAARVAAAVGATPAQTVVSARFGGDGGQLSVNDAADAVAAGRAEIVLVSGAEAGATLAALQKRDETPAWPAKDDGVAPTRVLGDEREASNDAESAAGLGQPKFMYALIETAIRGQRGASAAEHDARIAELWSRFADVAADNPYAWQPERRTADEITAVGPDNRMISTPYRKLMCANLQVDLAAGLIVCSAAAAEAAGVPQERWVFVHAGAAAQDDWFVSERADLTASPAIRAIGDAALGHAGVSVADVAHVDLYACFPSAVEIGAAALRLPVDDPRRPLTVTGGLTFGGGPGNNYGTHAVANLVGRLREDPDAYGLTTSLGWFLTKHAIGVYSARPPARPYRHLHPAVPLPTARRALTSYTGPAVVESWTAAYGRDGEPTAATVSVLTPAGDRVLLRVVRRELLELLLQQDPLHRPVTVSGRDEFELAGDGRVGLPAAPAAPVLVERRDGVAVVTLNRPEVRNAIDPRTALLLERAIDDIDADDEVRVAVLTGAGGFFSAGMDLRAGSRGEFPFSRRRGLLGLTERPPRTPLIAAVEGPALAGGCELALSADLVVASAEAQFGLPEPKRGLVAAAGGVLRLAQRLPRALALELVLTGDPIGAERAAAIGLINRVVPPGTALDEALELAGRIAVNAPLSVALSKRIVDESADWPAEEAFARQNDVAAPALGSADAAEGMRAFVEKRPPVWTGR